ncbi:hypothetical protein [Peribacillus muralis]
MGDASTVGSIVRELPYGGYFERMELETNEKTLWHEFGLC